MTERKKRNLHPQTIEVIESVRKRPRIFSVGAVVLNEEQDLVEAIAGGDPEETGGSRGQRILVRPFKQKLK